ncbi:hypothetical protein QYM36_001572 [Artemia franciscana]|uniref:Uncharacterized protein n=1 Tax=Artemia franciscana TaxID=6661 RepID=A0AA88IP64_ARTSF|nr:hypothetical protein QYM36_001572 [Artemia franciscana]
MTRLCETRWVERHDSVMYFLELCLLKLRSRETLEENINAETSAKVSQTLDVMNQSEFVMCLHVIKELSCLTLPLCKTFQSADCDLAAACRHVKTVLSRTMTIRQNYVATFAPLFDKGRSSATTLGLEMTHPTTRGGRKSNLDDPDFLTHYKTSLFIPFLDYFISELKQGFELYQNLLSHLSILVPLKIVSVDPKP